jgi:glycosyltransferase involved in cell wall biosynthesis
MSQSEPFVSVVTPVYNGGPYIAECVESVLNQGYHNFEYLIVNNCSTDNTLEIVQRYAKNDRRVRLINNSDFLSVMVNHNYAMNQISPASKYCKIVCADDWLYPDCLTQMVGFADEHPTVGIVGSYSLQGSRVLFQGLDYSVKVVNGRDICRNTMTGAQPYVFGDPTSQLVRADLVRQTKTFFPYPEDGPHGDVSACYQWLKDCDFGFVHQVLSYARAHAGSETSLSFKTGAQERAWLADRARFGPLYLGPKELQEQLRISTDKYYAWLVAALMENSFDKTFLQQQRASMRAIGFDLTTARIVRAALRRGVEFAEHPRTTSKKIALMLKRRGQVVAREYRENGF